MRPPPPPLSQSGGGALELVYVPLHCTCLPAFRSQIRPPLAAPTRPCLHQAEALELISDMTAEEREFLRDEVPRRCVVVCCIYPYGCGWWLCRQPGRQADGPALAAD